MAAAKAERYVARREMGGRWGGGGGGRACCDTEPESGMRTTEWTWPRDRRVGLTAARALRSTAGAALEALEPRQLLSVTFEVADVPSGPVYDGATGDVNGDGYADLVSAENADPGSDPVWVLRYALGRGDGTFEDAVTLDPNLSGQVVIADFDGDGRADVLAGSGTVLFAQTSALTFVRQDVAAQRVLIAGVIETGVGVELGFVGTTSQGTVAVFRIEAGQRVSGATIQVGAVSSHPSVWVGDLDGDGDRDVLARVAGNGVLPLWNDLDGDLRSGVTQPAALPSSSTSVLLSDQNADGRADLLQSAAGVIHLIVNTGDGVFGAARVAYRSPPDSGFALVGTADFDGDGLLDVFGERSLSVGNSSTRSVAVLLNLADGRFGALAFADATTVSSSSRGFFTVWSASDFTGDGTPDILFAKWTEPRFDPTPDFLGLRLATAIRGPILRPAVIDSLSGPSWVTAGTTKLDVRITTSFDAQPTWTAVEDLDASGDVSPGDLALRTISAVEVEPGRWRLSLEIPEPASASQVRRFLVVANQIGLTSVPAAYTPQAWSRSFYPGGLGGQGEREVITLFNPHGEAVPFEIGAQYERGVRDGVILSGTLRPGERREVLISNGLTPGRVRRNVPYALEVRSALVLSAFFEHTRTRGAGQAVVGESLTTLTSTLWVLPEVATTRQGSVMLYNPTGAPLTVTMTYHNARGVGTVHTVELGPRRSAAVQPDDVVGLREGTTYSVSLQALRGFAAAITEYRQEAGVLEGFTSLAARPGDAPVLELGQGAQYTASVFNTGGLSSMEVVIDYWGANGVQGFLPRVLTVPSGRRVFFDPTEGLPAGARYASVRTAEPAGLFIRTRNADRGDALAMAPAAASSSIAFAHAEVDLTAAEVERRSTLLIRNANGAADGVVVRFHFDDGTVIERAFGIAAFGERAMRLDRMSGLRRSNGHFSITIESINGVIAGLTQWTASGGWQATGSSLVRSSGQTIPDR